jgi:putative stage II sporulation protein R
MKKIVLIIAMITSILIYSEIKKDTVVIPNSAIRLRVIPNSNSAQDQNIKKQVKTYLEKNTYNILKDEKSIKEARKKINENIPVIEENVDRIFKDNNYDVSYNVNYGYNYFPSKTYRGITYKEGYYESIVISIGAAEGDNWWCVLFPNLCLADLEQKENSEYKSWVIETINKIF